MKKRKKSIKGLLRFDKSNMLDLIKSFPGQCESAVSLGNSVSIPDKFKKEYKNVVFLGLGGSAIGAAIIGSYLADKCGIPILVVRDYNLPGFVGSGTLVFANSYSGNTEETLSMYRQAASRNANVISITSGGELERSARGSQGALIVIPSGLPPRAALGYSLVTPLVILSRLGVIDDQKAVLADAVRNLRVIFENTAGPDAEKNSAFEIAEKIQGRFPVIYGAGCMDAVAARWRSQINENAKTLASSHCYPELDHNEIVGWQEPRKVLKQFVAVNLRDRDYIPEIKKRIDITSAIIKKAGFTVMDVHSTGESLLARVLSLIYVGDFVSYYLSLLNKIDPTPVERIAYLKEKLRGMK